MAERHIGYLVKQINELIKQRADKDMQCCGVTFSQGRIIGFLMENGGEAPQKALTEHLGASAPTVTGLITRMEKKGMLSCREDPDDRRGKMVALTDKSRAAASSLVGLISAQEERMVKGLTQQQADELGRLLETVLSNVSEP